MTPTTDALCVAVGIVVGYVAGNVLFRHHPRRNRMDEDSIDGLGLTIGDIAGTNAAAVAQFRLTKRIEKKIGDIQTNEVRPSFMAEMRELAMRSVVSADAARDEFDKIGRS